MPSIAFTRAIVWARPSNRAVGGVVDANAIACVPPSGPGQPGARVAAGTGVASAAQGSGPSPGGWERLQRTIAGRKEGLRFDCAAKGGRRGVGDLRLNDIHRHAVNANCRVRLGIRVYDGVLHRVDVHV